MTTTTINQVADAIRAAGADRTKMRELMAGLYAETIFLHHEPELPSDGPRPSSMLVTLGALEVAALERALPEATTTAPEVTVEGDDRVRVRSRTRGTLADGTAVDVTTNTVFTVVDGRIAGLRSEMAPQDVATWGAVLAAGNFEVPAGLLET